MQAFTFTFQKVSIHSGHCWPENPGQNGDTRCFLRFQSTPAIAGRRILPHSGRGSCGDGFNPLRPLLAGESEAVVVGTAAAVVSIHSGHCWPENLKKSGRCARAKVSIHSGHCWPENPLANPKSAVIANVSIHSGHCWPENRVAALARQACAGSFNPLRPLLAGESRARRPPTDRSGFNPLRPLLAGESPSKPRRARSTSFNPLRPLLAGESTSVHQCWASIEFQSTPAIAGRRIVERVRSWIMCGGFQSTPAIAGRRIRASRRLSAIESTFQSTPAIAGRRINQQDAITDASGLFQSTPAIAGRRI